jgi:O-antigen ligase
MARRPHPSPGPAPSRPAPSARAGAAEAAEPGLFDFDPDATARLAERLRRLALGLTAALVSARAYWPSEFAAEEHTGRGLPWVLALLAALALAIAGLWIGGRTRLRFSWSDAAVVLLMLLVGLSASHALERRMAINLAWEWAGLGIAYVLLRNLPRTPAESSTLAGALVATAVAVSVYGLYQVAVEFPETRAMYLKDPERALKIAGVSTDAASRKHFEDRLLGSSEPTATFALANSLAGFLVGPAALALAVAFGAVVRRDPSGPSPGVRAVALALAAVPGAVLLLTLLLTKSRSAYVGLAVGLAVLAWRERRRVPGRVLALGALGVVAALAVLAAVAIFGGGLDRKVLTESTKSLRYRWEYWTGAVGVISESPWGGHGPGNFAGPYLRHKLPQSSEEITDPHNLVLEVWSCAGALAAVALLAAFAFALWGIFGPARPADQPPEIAKPGAPGAPPRSPAWLLAWSAGSLIVVVLPGIGQLNPIFLADDLIRWLILGVSWALAVAFGLSLWRLGPVPASAVGVGALALAVSLLGAGGIGIPSVALSLWALLALGQDLRDDRPCGRLRDLGGRWPAFGLAAVWAALAGIFFAAVVPFWKSQSALAEAYELARTGRAGREQIDALFLRAGQGDQAHMGDRYSITPWLALADFEHQAWRSRGRRGPDRVWPQIAWALDQATTLPRNPRSLAALRLRARILDDLLHSPDLPEVQARHLRVERKNALARASALYPASAQLHAELAEALAAVGSFHLAAREGREADRLDDLTPHKDKKLPEDMRKDLDGAIKRWEKASDATDRPR